MQTLHSDNATHVLRLDKNENLFVSLTTFCKDQKIKSGWFQGLGAADSLVLSYYDLKAKKYRDTQITGDVEIVSLTGNIGWLQDDYAFHAHGVFSKSDYTTVGGHLKKLIVSATCEIFITTLPILLTRKFDSKTGLNLLTKTSRE